MTSYASMILGGEARNVEQLGAYIAWLINNRLFADYIERVSADALAKVRIQGVTGADFLATELYGELLSDQLTEAGREFTERYLLSGRYEEDYRKVEFDGENEWVRYSDLAPLISAAYRGFEAEKNPSIGKKIARVLKFPGVK